MLSLTNAQQKNNLVTMCLQQVVDTGVKIVGLTFDGARTNISLCGILGSELNIKKDEFYFQIQDCEAEVAILPDACHNVKLIRNAFGDFGTFCYKDQIIEWKFIKALEELQAVEGLHLGNKIRKAHIYFSKQKMKVRLAVHVFSRSVADAIDFCHVVIFLL